MPIIKSAKKALRQEKRRTEVNNAVRVRMKESLKLARAQKTAESVSVAYSALDRAAKTNVIHKNKASRLKSRLAKFVGTRPVKKRATAKSKVKVAKTSKK